MTWRLLFPEGIRSPRTETTTKWIASSLSSDGRWPAQTQKNGTKTRMFLTLVGTHRGRSRRVIRHRANCVPATLHLSLRRRALWQCDDGDVENLVVSAFGSSPGDAAVKSGSAVRAQDGASCGVSVPAGANRNGALAEPTPGVACKALQSTEAGPSGGGICAEAAAQFPQCAGKRDGWPPQRPACWAAAL